MATFLQSASVLCLLKGLLDCLCSVAATAALPFSKNLSITAVASKHCFGALFWRKEDQVYRRLGHRLLACLLAAEGIMCGRARCTLSREEVMAAARVGQDQATSWRHAERYQPSANVGPGQLVSQLGHEALH